MSHDTIVHGKDHAEHGARLELAIKRRKLTLNAAKCQLSMDKLAFVGMVLSTNWISCAADKVEAVTSAREPQRGTSHAVVSCALLESGYSEEQESSSRRSIGPECYPLLTKATWALLELSKRIVAKYAGPAWRETQRNIVKPAMGVSWSVVPPPQSLLGPHPYPLDRGETWLLICSDHFLLANPSWPL